MERKIRLHLTGTRPMLLHNGRLANPLDPHTRAIAAIATKKKKTDSELAELAAMEARGGMYETAKGELGLPYDNVWRCLFDAGKAYKLGSAIKQALVPSPDIAVLIIGGKPQKCDTYVTGPDRFLYGSVVVNGRRTMRARVIIPAGWEAEVKFVLLEDVLQAEKLKPVLERAGRLCGLCDWRPKYGTFEAEMVL